MSFHTFALFMQDMRACVCLCVCLGVCTCLAMQRQLLLLLLLLLLQFQFQFPGPPMHPPPGYIFIPCTYCKCPMPRVKLLINLVIHATKMSGPRGECAEVAGRHCARVAVRRGRKWQEWQQRLGFIGPKGERGRANDPQITTDFLKRTSNPWPQSV